MFVAPGWLTEKLTMMAVEPWIQSWDLERENRGKGVWDFLKSWLGREFIEEKARGRGESFFLCVFHSTLR